MSDLAKSDYWLRRAAEEAFAVTESPLVIPSLKTLFEIGSTQNDVSPLGKFRANSDAENLLLSIIRKDKGTTCDPRFPFLRNGTSAELG